jgi:hypothetical protein
MSNPAPSTSANPASAFYAGVVARSLGWALRTSQSVAPAAATRLALRLFFTPLPLKLVARRQPVPAPWRTERWPFEQGSMTAYRRDDPHAELDAATNPGQALRQLGGLRAHCRGQLLVAGEGPAELRGQNRPAVAHQPFDDLRVPQHSLLRDLVPRGLAHHELEVADSHTRERRVANTSDRGQGVELVDDPVDVDHRSASPIATGMPCSSSVDTEERSTRKPR